MTGLGTSESEEASCLSAERKSRPDREHGDYTGPEMGVRLARSMTSNEAPVAGALPAEHVSRQCGHKDDTSTHHGVSITGPFQRVYSRREMWSGTHFQGPLWLPCWTYAAAAKERSEEMKQEARALIQVSDAAGSGEGGSSRGGVKC